MQILLPGVGGKRYFFGHEERKIELFSNKIQSFYGIWLEVWSQIGN